nr:MAG TPA: hypothetical protein [Caudoviricetes sp.]
MPSLVTGLVLPVVGVVSAMMPYPSNVSDFSGLFTRWL